MYIDSHCHLQHTFNPNEIIEFSKTKDGYALDFQKGWLSENPLLHADLIQEQAYLKEVGIELH